MEQMTCHLGEACGLVDLLNYDGGYNSYLVLNLFSFN